jgi:pimeloyl-ACP methyl ester carboxylesterase
VTRSRKIRWTVCILLLMVLCGCALFWARPIGVFHTISEIRLRFAGAESRWTTVEGYRVHYYAAGPENGPAVVLIHGLGGRADDWTNLIPYLSSAGYRVYFPDLPGYGQSERPAGFSYSVTDQASIVVGFFDALGLKQVDLGGWSMGGWIVQRVAAEHPDRVRKLLLFDSAGLRDKPDWNTALFTPSNAAEIAELDALLMPNPPNVPGFIASDILRVSKENAWVIHRALDSMLTGRETTDLLLPELKMPVLIVWGAEDHITPLSQGEAIHKLIPQSQLEVFSGCGHLAPSQCAAQIGPKVIEFVKH